MRRVMVIAVLVAGCGRIAFDPLGGPNDASRDTPPARTCTSWAAPQPIPTLESGSQDWDPAIHPGGQLLVFESERAANGDLYTSTLVGGAWTAPQTIAALNTAALDDNPDWNASGTRLYFVSQLGGNYHLYQSDYDGTFTAPALVPGLETITATTPAIASDELEMFYTDYRPEGFICRATRPSVTSPWTTAGAVPELDAAGDNGWATLGPDDLELYFESTRNGPEQTIYVTRRPSRTEPFGPATPVVELDSPGDDEGDPEFNPDGTGLMFSSNRPGAGQNDIYQTTRVCN